MKKIYMKPETTVLMLNMNNSLLAESITESTDKVQSMSSGSFGSRSFGDDWDDADE